VDVNGWLGYQMP